MEKYFDDLTVLPMGIRKEGEKAGFEKAYGDKYSAFLEIFENLTPAEKANRKIQTYKKIIKRFVKKDS